jgi:Potential Queuosine, Q, salvage protein family
VFVVDAMNFCFWPGNPAGEFEYEHMTKNLAKIMEQEPHWFEAKHLSSVTKQQLIDRVFIGKDKFALLEERARIVREVGTVIDTEYEGSFIKYLEGAEWDAPRLVRQIGKDLTGFRDEAIYNGEQVFFYKRAQILVADLYGALSERTAPKDGLKTPEFTNLE